MTIAAYQNQVIGKIYSIVEPRKIEVCGICGEQTIQMPANDDSLSFCTACDSVVEGNTNIVEVEND